MRLLLYKTKMFTFFFQYLLVVNRRDELVHFTNPASPCPAAQSLSSPPLVFSAARSSRVALPRSKAQTALASLSPLFLYH